MNYPILKKYATIGVTAPSSGVPEPLHHLLETCQDRFKERGYHLKFGETVWTQDKAKSADAKTRAAEFESLLKNPDVDLIIPPWGGELAIEVLEELSYKNYPVKWVLGYSDTSGLLLALTLKVGMATAVGPNLVDLRGTRYDETTAMWQEVLATAAGDSVAQTSSEHYQLEWDHANPTPHVFHLTEDTYWKTVSGEDIHLKGRLLGGCVDILRHLIGTPYGNVKNFRKKFTEGEPIIWFLENSELRAADLRRTLVQMKLAGWFEDCAGILFGRSCQDIPTENYTNLDAYEDLAADLGIPIAYDIDQGHLPPQMTFVNGSLAEVKVANGRGTVIQTFK